MTGASYLDHLKDQMRTLEIEITRARHQLELDTIEAKAAALKQLAALQQQQVELAERINEATKENADSWSDFHKGMKLEMDGLRQSFEKWLETFK